MSVDSPAVGSSRSDAAPAVRAEPGPGGPRIGAFVLLAGSVRGTAFSREIGRSPLDLPLRDHETVLRYWSRGASGVASVVGAGVPLRVLVDRSARLPESVPSGGELPVKAEHDPQELRGTGGVLRDVAEEFAPDEVLLVGHAYELPVTPLADLVQEMLRVGGDATLLTDEAGTPLGLKLVRRACLDLVKPKGFIDFKEQALPLIASRFDVRIARVAGASALPLRTLEGYLRALRRFRAPPGAETDPLAEDWFSTFSVVEPGAEVGAGARVHDSVVLAGARVGAGAVIVRSLVCAGASVAPGEVVFDRLVSATATSRTREVAA